MIPLERYLTLPVLVLAILPQTQSAVYPCWISGCKSLQPKAWFPTRRRSSFDPQVGGSNYSCFQLYLEWWSQFMVYCSLYIIYTFFGMGWNHQQLNGMAWHGDGMQSTKTTHGIGHLASAHWKATSLSLFISLHLPRHAGRRCSTLDEISINKQMEMLSNQINIDGTLGFRSTKKIAWWWILVTQYCSTHTSEDQWIGLHWKHLRNYWIHIQIPLSLKQILGVMKKVGRYSLVPGRRECWLPSTKELAMASSELASWLWPRELMFQQCHLTRRK